MIQTAAFQRKVIYLGLMAVLLIPLYMIGHPATGDPNSEEATTGGQLAKLRAEYGLSPTELGEIDPASESMRLATLGMKGVAANLMWTKAFHYKKTEDWEKLVATVQQITKLQPNFITIWEFQSHNLTYNVSAEHDDYRFRYLWVKKGIEFLIQGTHYNRKEPKLFWTVGWYTGQKFGTADEHRQFRRLFPEDDDFHESLERYIPLDTHARGANQQPDNWLASHLWYERAYNIVDTEDAPIRGKSPHIFYADGPKALINYAVAIEKEGYLDERAAVAWKRGGDAWYEYGDRVVPTSWGDSIRLNDQERLYAESIRLEKELDEVASGAREQIYKERLATLTPQQQELLSVPHETIDDPEIAKIKFQATQRMLISYEEVAENAPAAVRARADKIVRRLEELARLGQRIVRYRDNVNFNYWRTRCETEQKSECVKARRHVYRARQLLKDVLLDEAQVEFEAAWEEWRTLFDDNESLVSELTADDLYEDIQAYLQLLGQLDLDVPQDFALQPVLMKLRQEHDYEYQYRQQWLGNEIEPSKLGTESNEDGEAPGEEKTEGEPESTETPQQATSDTDAPPKPEADEAAPATEEDSAPATEDAAPAANDAPDADDSAPAAAADQPASDEAESPAKED